WEAVALARGFLALQSGESEDAVARDMYKRGAASLSRCRALIPDLKARGFLHLLKVRERLGSAENPITKMFPATITEERFIEALEELCQEVSGLSYTDERESGHSLVDFTLHQGDLELPINVKNAGTRFERAQDLVGLDPADCIPIPA